MCGAALLQGETVIQRADTGELDIFVGENSTRKLSVLEIPENLVDFQEILEDYNETKVRLSVQNCKRTRKLHDMKYMILQRDKYNVNWRTGLQFIEALNHMRNNLKWTDCVFIVGKDEKIEVIKHTCQQNVRLNFYKFIFEQKIEAHVVILAVASPVFEAAFENATSFRIADWQPSDFKKLLLQDIC